MPDAKMLHPFRDQLGVGGLRMINTHLLMGLLDSCRPDRKTVAIIDSTDLPAATNAYKKTGRGVIRLQALRSGDAPASTATAVGLWAIKNTPSGCGSTPTTKAYCWLR